VQVNEGLVGGFEVTLSEDWSLVAKADEVRWDGSTRGLRMSCYLNGGKRGVLGCRGRGWENTRCSATEYKCQNKNRRRDIRWALPQVLQVSSPLV